MFVIESSSDEVQMTTRLDVEYDVGADRLPANTEQDDLL